MKSSIVTGPLLPPTCYLRRVQHGYLCVCLRSQTLSHYNRAGHQVAVYPVSTALRGAGNQKGSYQTPLGWHCVRAKIGHGAPVNTVFIARRPTGEQWTPGLLQQYPDRDWILTRILWLSGLEMGRNRLGQVDTWQRYIYIHGCPDTVPLGVPGSLGCIRMRNAHIVTLFDHVSVGIPIGIYLCYNEGNRSGERDESIVCDSSAA